MTVAFVVSVAVLLGLLLFLVREVRRGPRRPRILLGTIVLLLAFVVFWGFFIEPNRLIVKYDRDRAHLRPQNRLWIFLASLPR